MPNRTNGERPKSNGIGLLIAESAGGSMPRMWTATHHPTLNGDRRPSDDFREYVSQMIAKQQTEDGIPSK
jgi:hypothetical protein